MEQACPHKVKPMSVAPSFGIAPNWKQLKTSTYKQIDLIYTVEYDPEVNKNEHKYIQQWVDLEMIM